jgi:peptide/nickel transport system substrate-binding protein
MPETASDTPMTILQPTVVLSDPHICSDVRDRLSLRMALYEPLLRRVPGGGYAPALAERWELNDDARSWVFTLRAGVRCHNGDLFSPEDVLASLTRAVDPAVGGEMGTQGVYAGYLGDVQVRVLDERRVQLVTPQPMADLLDILCEIVMLPRAALASLPGPAAGTGPYRLVDARPGLIEVAAFSDYWGNPALYRRLIFQAEPDPAARVAALRQGNADLAVRIDAAGREVVAIDERLELIKSASSLCVILMCNAQSGPCRDPQVRQALNYAVDVPALIERLMPGAATPSNGPLTPLHFGYDPETSPYPYDPQRARELLAAAGYEQGLALSLDLPAILPDESPELAALIQAQFAAAGIDLTLRTHSDRPAYAMMVREKRIGDLCVFDSSPLSTVRVLREKLHSELHGPWWQGYHNPEVNALLDRALTTVDVQVREQIYRQAYRRIRDDAPWVFLYEPQLFWAAGARMRDWRPSADGLILS